jgi:hypothetical protein
MLACLNHNNDRASHGHADRAVADAKGQREGVVSASIPFIGPEDLIVTKILAGRPKDSMIGFRTRWRCWKTRPVKAICGREPR